jgi:hypothetical protein
MITHAAEPFRHEERTGLLGKPASGKCATAAVRDFTFASDIR